MMRKHIIRQLRRSIEINLDDIFRTLGGDIEQHDEQRMGRISGVLCL